MFFYGDFDKAELEAELLTLQQLYQSAIGSEAPIVDSIKKALLTLSNTQRMLIKAVCRLFQLLIVLLATNATSERSFSALSRVRSCLRSTMTQARLNHLMILHYHQYLCDKLDLNSVTNEYTSRNDSRQSIHVFATF